MKYRGRIQEPESRSQKAGRHGYPSALLRVNRAGGAAQKSKNCKTNPSLFKPAWKFVPDKAKNEAKLEGSMGSKMPKTGITTRTRFLEGCKFHKEPITNDLQTSSVRTL